jgi:hypothetical protein
MQVRIVRLIRLTKLLRIFRVSRFMAAIESSVSVNYSQLHLFQHIVVIVLATHWIACACLLFSRLEVWLQVDATSVAVQWSVRQVH